MPLPRPYIPSGRLCFNAFRPTGRQCGSRPRSDEKHRPISGRDVHSPWDAPTARTAIPAKGSPHANPLRRTPARSNATPGRRWPIDQRHLQAWTMRQPVELAGLGVPLGRSINGQGHRHRPVQRHGGGGRRVGTAVHRRIAGDVAVQPGRAAQLHRSDPQDRRGQLRPDGPCGERIDPFQRRCLACLGHQPTGSRVCGGGYNAPDIGFDVGLQRSGLEGPVDM